jgi:hypothetical protein
VNSQESNVNTTKISRVNSQESNVNTTKISRVIFLWSLHCSLGSSP